jgi:ABC-type ATPase with predicted acetyltransferase domain
MKFNITKEHKYQNTERVSEIIKYFDLQGPSVKEEFNGEIDLDFDWNIGLIVGNSGTGKTTIAKQLFGEDSLITPKFGNRSIVDEFPEDIHIDDIIKSMMSVGFSSPPSWLKPYDVLSMGEKMRVDLSYSLLTKEDTIVFDEFTSVVDRITARYGCELFEKKVRQMNKKFVGISCHEDVLDYMNPDWVFDTNTMEFYLPSKKKFLTPLKSIKQNIEDCGTFLESITI